MAHSRIAALDKGATIACEPRIAVNHLWCSDTYLQYMPWHKPRVSPVNLPCRLEEN